MNDASQVADGAANLVAHALGGAEHERLERVAAFRRVVENVHQSLLLFETGANFNRLRNVLVGDELVRLANVDLNRVGQNRRGDANHRLWPRGGEEESLSIDRDVGKNLTNLRLETHVQHSISLVEDDVRSGGHVDVSALQQIIQTTRSGDANLRSVAKLVQLATLGGATVEAHRKDAHRLTKLVALFLNLRRELSCRRQREHHWSTRVSPVPTLGNVHQARK